MNGSISWRSTETQVHTDRTPLNVAICTDYDGYPFILSCTVLVGTYIPFIIEGATNDGTWVEDYEGSWGGGTAYNGNQDYESEPRVLPIDDEIIMLVGSRDVNGKYQIDSRFYTKNTDTNYGLDLVYKNTISTTNNERKWDVTSYSDRATVVFWDMAGRLKTWDIELSGPGTWENATTHITTSTALTPDILSNSNGNLTLFVQDIILDCINYTRRFSNYTWESYPQFLINCSNAGGYAIGTEHNYWSPIPLVWYNASLAVFHSYWFEDISLPCSHLNTTLYNYDGTVNDGWIFEGEVYDLVSFVENATRFIVNTTDSRHQIRFNFNNETEQMWISVNPSDQFTIGLVFSNITRTGNVTRLQWTFIPDRSIIDAEEEAWDYYIEYAPYDYNFSGSLNFNTSIYNLGGFTYYNFTGDGGRIARGHPWELHATNGTEGSFARAEQIYRKLQHIHFLIEIDMDNEWDVGNGEFDIDPGVGYVDIGIDYRLNSTWIEGFYVRLFVEDADVGHHNAGNDHDWIEWSVDWYNYDPLYGTHSFVSDYIYSNHWGYDNENLSPDYHNRTSSQLWVDLWFDRTNASTTVAGQVNAMYFGMREHGSSWWPGYGVFQPMRGEYENSMFLDDLYDEGGNVTDSLKYDLMRVFIEVGKVANADGDDETWTIRAIENINRKLADDRMQGIEQPSFEETLVLEMPMFQSLNPLIRAIDGISVSIWKGALGFQKILWGAMDSFFAWAGFGEGFFSRITAFLMTLPEIFIAFMEFMPILLEEMAEIIESVFTAIVLMIPFYTISIGTMVETIIDYWNILSQLLNGQLLPFDIIQDIQLGDWINAGITMLPTYEIFGIIFDDNPGRRAEQRMAFYSKLFGGLIGFLKDIASFMQQAIQTIMDIIPG